MLEFGFESLRDLPDLEALRDAGLMQADGLPGGGEAEGAPDGLPPLEVSRDRVA